MITHTRYWLRNLKTDEEFVVAAFSLKEAIKRLGWERSFTQVCGTKRKEGEPSKLILKY